MCFVRWCGYHEEYSYIKLISFRSYEVAVKNGLTKLPENIKRKLQNDRKLDSREKNLVAGLEELQRMQRQRQTRSTTTEKGFLSSKKPSEVADRIPKKARIEDNKKRRINTEFPLRNICDQQPEAEKERDESSESSSAEDELWTLVKILSIENVTAKPVPIKCFTKDCLLPAACAYISDRTPNTKYYLCLDCQVSTSPIPPLL